MRDSSESGHFSVLDGFAFGANDSVGGLQSIAKSHVDGSGLHGASAATGGRVVVGDSHLVFSGHYARSGSDLVISDDDRKLLVPDYFKGTGRADIYSREGASLSGAVVDALAGPTVFAQAGAAAPAGTPIGKVAKLTGTASVVRNGVTVDLNIGDNVFKGDVVQAGQDSALGVIFVDGTAFSLGSNARMVLNDMVYDPNGSSNSSFLSLVQGTITFVAGQTAKNGSMRIDTPVATMGIRGTAVLVEIAANDGPTKFSVLVEPGNHVGSYELYSRVTGERIGTVNQAGIVTLVTPSGFNQLSITEQVKTLADMQAERDLIQQVFSMAFQKLNDADPKSNGGSSGSSYWLFGDDKLYQFTTDGQIKLANLLLPDADSRGSSSFDATITIVPPPTVKVSDVSAPQAGGVGNVDDIQSSVSVIKSFNIGDRVVVDQTSVGSAPFYNIVVPYVSGTAVLTNTTGPSALPGSFNLASLITIDPVSGKITYDPSNFQFLGKGENAVYTITFDSYGGPATANLTSNEPYTVHTTLELTLVGLNDAPVFSTTGSYQYTGSYADALNGAAHALVGDTTGTTPLTSVLLSERPAVTGSGASDTATIVLNFTDQDFSDVTSGYLAAGHTPSVHFVGASGVTGGLPADIASTFGSSLSIESLTKNLDDIHGQLTASFTAPDHLFDYLAAGESVTLSYTLQITDTNGASGTETVNVVVTGSNDPAVIGNPDVASVTEDFGVDANGNLLASGHIGISDADHGQSSFQTDVVAHDGDLGVLTLQSDGSYVYSVANSAVAYLGADQTRTDVFTVTAADGTTKDVSFDIHGVNDAPVIAIDGLSAVHTDEDRIAFSGLHVSDADAASTETYTLQAQTVYGTLSSNGDSGTLVAINGDLAGFVYQTNESDEEHVEMVTVSVTDGHGASDSLNFIFSTADFPVAPVVLAGTTGKDVFLGSSVAEQFVFAPQSGKDTILDFSPSQDQIDLRAVVTTDDVNGWMAQHVTAVGADTLITIDSQDSITLKNVAASSLHASDFIVSSHSIG